MELATRYATAALHTPYRQDRREEAQPQAAAHTSHLDRHIRHSHRPPRGTARRLRHIRGRFYRPRHRSRKDPLLCQNTARRHTQDKGFCHHSVCTNQTQPPNSALHHSRHMRTRRRRRFRKDQLVQVHGMGYFARIYMRNQQMPRLAIYNPPAPVAASTVYP